VEKRGPPEKEGQKRSIFFSGIETQERLPLIGDEVASCSRGHQRGTKKKRPPKSCDGATLRKDSMVRRIAENPWAEENGKDIAARWGATSQRER